MSADHRAGRTLFRPGFSRLTEDELFLRAAVEQLRESPVVTVGRESWRVFRIMGEFVEGFDELSHLGRAVTIFGSARTPPEDPLYQKCVETARLLGEAGFAVITGGGPGMMQAANQGAQEAGASSVGLNIELPFEQDLNPYADLKIHFRYFFVRKTMFVKYAQAFVIFPGGFGTLDELFESLTLIQTGKIRNFPLVLFGSEYWGDLLRWLRKRVEIEGKISPGDMDLIYLTDSPQDARDHIIARYKETLRERGTDEGDSSGPDPLS
ncbi:TIGR00730 family Rossman fold protein [Gemmatimonadota bacterium]